MQIRRHKLPIGNDEIPLLVATVGDEPTAVFMSYEAYLELAATLFTAVAALKAAGVDPALFDESAPVAASVGSLTQVG